jgi:hypothetical protein
MDSILDFDDLVLARIVEYLGPYGALGLRGTCARFRAMIRAPRKFDAETGRAPHGYEPRVRTPQQMWRWARRRGFVELMDEACDAGARDVARYLGAGVEFAEVRAMWCARFACDECAYYDSEESGGCDEDDREIQDTLFAMIRGDVRGCYPTRSRRMAIFIGKYASDADVRRVASELVGSYWLDGIIGGVVRSGRDALARELISIRLAHDTEFAECIEMYMLSANRADLCASWERCNKRIQYKNDMLHDAMRGGIDACMYAYIRCECDVSILQFLANATAIKGSLLCVFARKWFDSATRECTSFEPGFDGDFMGGNVTHWFSLLLGIAARNGNREACEYLRSWAASRDPRASLDFAKIAASAVQRDAYWIADLITQWNREAVESETVMVERRAHPLCDAVIRARLARM